MCVCVCMCVCMCVLNRMLIILIGKSIKLLNLNVPKEPLKLDICAGT